MKRTELIELVARSADDAGLIATDKDAVIKAVSNPSVTRIACGTWFNYCTPDGQPCGCPAALGYGLKPTQNEDSLPAQAHRFAESFDVAVGALPEGSNEATASLIEIEDA